MSTTDLRRLPADEQERRIVAAVRGVLPAFGLDGGEVALLDHEFNATCTVDHPDGRFALRCNIASAHDADAVAAELAWAEALHADGVAVARPRQPTGGDVPTVAIEGVDHQVPVAAYHWLDGEDLGTLVDDRPDEALPWLRGLGAQMARLQEHARDWSLPEPLTRPTFTSVLLGTEDRLSDADGPWRTDRVDELLTTAWTEVQAGCGDVLADTSTHLLLHADLHPWNAKTTAEGSVPIVFDFDDAGFGHPVLDLAIAVFYLRDEPRNEAALLEGLADASPLGASLADAVGTPAFEAMVAGRQRLLLDDLLCNPVGPPLDFDVVAYADKAATRFEHWLETGRFTLVP